MWTWKVFAKIVLEWPVPPFQPLQLWQSAFWHLLERGLAVGAGEMGCSLDEFVWTKERFLSSRISITPLPVNGAVFSQATYLDHSTSLAAGTWSISGGAMPPGSPGSQMSSLASAWTQCTNLCVLVELLGLLSVLTSCFRSCAPGPYMESWTGESGFVKV